LIHQGEFCQDLLGFLNRDNLGSTPVNSLDLLLV
jgi:hypothetical protein